MSAAAKGLSGSILTSFLGRAENVFAPCCSGLRRGLCPLPLAGRRACAGLPPRGRTAQVKVKKTSISGASEYSLINIEGKVLATGQFENTQGLIDLSPYDEGIYYVKTNGVSLKLVKSN